MAAVISEARTIVAQPTPLKDGSQVKPSSESSEQEAGFSFGEILSSVPVGFDLTKALFQTNSTLQIKPTEMRESNTVKTIDTKEVKETKNDGPIRVVEKNERIDTGPVQQTRTDGLFFQEAEILDTAKAGTVSMRPQELIATEKSTEEGFSFSSLTGYSHLKNEADEEGTDSARTAMMQQAVTTGPITTTDKLKFVSQKDKTVAADMHLSSDPSLIENDFASKEIVTDPQITHLLNRTPQQQTTAQVQILAQPVVMVPPLASAVPLQFIERGSSDAIQPHANLIAATVVDGEKAQSSGNEGSSSQDHSGSFTNQRSSETASAQMKTTESLSHTSTQQAEKVQALQQVIQDFRRHLSQISGRPTNLKISVQHEKFGNVDVKLNFNEKDKTVSAVFHADSAEMVQMLTQQRSEIEDIFREAKLNPTADSLKFYKTKEA